jgi:hypothetical protein
MRKGKAGGLALSIFSHVKPVSDQSWMLSCQTIIVELPWHACLVASLTN